MVDVRDSLTFGGNPENSNYSAEGSPDSVSTSEPPHPPRHTSEGHIPLDPASNTNSPTTDHSNSDSRLNSQFGPSQRLPERPNQGGAVHEYRLSQPTSDARPTSAGSTTIPRELGSVLSDQLQKLQQRQQTIPQTTSGLPTTPNIAAVRGCFPFAVFQGFRPGEASAISKVILVLHDYGGDEKSLQNFADEHLRQPDTLYILLRGVRPTGEGSSRFHWADSNKDPNGSFITASSKILELICQVLIKGSNICPSHILLFGQGQGGMAALSVATSWKGIEFGGIISIGGPIPDHFPLSERPNIKTPSLVIGGELGDVNATAKARIKSMIMYVDIHLEGGAEDCLPFTTRQTLPLQEFLEHRLRKAEWMKPSVLTLGIRGYGSLLILRELMSKVAKLEREADPDATTSFYPSEYKPQHSNTTENLSKARIVDNTDETELDLQRAHSRMPVSTPIDGLKDPHLFLPCHYFTYIGGTSTGGLIAIMLSRLRMSVEDCITEYKTLGGKVFGHPRPLPNKGIVWHKFNSDTLHNVIRDVVRRHHAKTSDFVHHYPSHEDFCKTVVVAFSSDGASTKPFLFRTYEAFHNRAISRRDTANPTRNPGKPQQIEISLVGRATSAAPGYFKPVSIPNQNGGGRSSFKDGGFGCNNPSNEVRRDVVNKHGGRNENLGPFISIGTGEQSGVHMFVRDGAFKKIRNVAQNLRTAISLPSLTEGAHLNMIDAARDGNKEIFPYFRFDGGPRLGKLPMDSWKGHKLTKITGRDPTSGCKTLEDMDSAIAMYLREDEVNNALDKAAKLLVKRRRLRTRDQSKWDRYACASWYLCPFGDCQKGTLAFETRVGFRRHVLNDHKYQVKEELLEASLATCRQCWLYD